MGLFIGLFVFWVAAIIAGKYLFTAWQRGRALQPARYLREIDAVEYYRRLSPEQFEKLVMRATRAQEYQCVGDPCLGRSDKQGFLWRKGKKSVLSFCLENPLTSLELDEIAKRIVASGAEQGLVFSPFPAAPETGNNALEVLSGKKLMSWFSAIGESSPPLPGLLRTGLCKCGSLMNERVSRAGKPMLVCSLYPDCQGMKTAEEVSAEKQPSGGIPTGQQESSGEVHNTSNP